MNKDLALEPLTFYYHIIWNDSVV